MSAILVYLKHILIYVVYKPAASACCLKTTLHVVYHILSRLALSYLILSYLSGFCVYFLVHGIRAERPYEMLCFMITYLIICGSLTIESFAFPLKTLKLVSMIFDGNTLICYANSDNILTQKINNLSQTSIVRPLKSGNE